MTRFGATGAVLGVGIALLSAGTSRPQRLSTWTIAAVDGSSGDVGAAGASCLPSTYADALAALVPGKGVGVAQSLWDLDNRNKLFELLRAGIPAPEIVRRLTDRGYDAGVNDRQYGVVTLSEGVVSTAAFTGKGNYTWAGSQQDQSSAVSVQGNTLAGPAVVEGALHAFKSTGERNPFTMPDRLMRALEAGSIAGGDIRCNNVRVKQTAATAFILFARGGDSAYAAADLGVSDQGTAKAPRLAISVSEKQFGPNPVEELRRRYDAWRKRQGQ